ncbi:hypothetical protein, partial [Desulfobacca acetoxidans]
EGHRVFRVCSAEYRLPSVLGLFPRIALFIKAVKEIIHNWQDLANFIFAVQYCRGESCIRPKMLIGIWFVSQKPKASLVGLPLIVWLSLDGLPAGDLHSGNGAP